MWKSKSSLSLSPILIMIKVDSSTVQFFPQKPPRFSSDQKDNWTDIFLLKSKSGGKLKIMCYLACVQSFKSNFKRYPSAAYIFRAQNIESNLNCSFLHFLELGNSQAKSRFNSKYKRKNWYSVTTTEPRFFFFFIN